MSQSSALPRVESRMLGLGLVVANVLWGVSYAVIKVAETRTSPGVLVAIAMPVAAGIAWGLHLLDGRPAELVPWREAARMAGLGNIGVTLNLMLAYRGLSLTGASDASMLIVGETLATAAFAVGFAREALSRRMALGMGLGLLGVGLVLYGGSVAGGGGRARLLGDGLLLVSTLCDAVYNVLGAQMARRYSPATMLRWGLTGTLPVWGIVLAWGAIRGGLPSFEPMLVAGVAWIAAVQTVACFLLWFGALARLGSHVGAVSIAVQPLAGVLVGVLVLGERLTVPVVVGGICVVGALVATATESEH